MHTFQPCSDKALSNLKVYVDSFRSIYPINAGISATSAVAVGRYPEDEYSGGNVPGGNVFLPLFAPHKKSADAPLQPWYLSTFAVAEQLYDALLTWESLNSLNVTNTSLHFFSQFIPNIKPRTYSSHNIEYWRLIRAIRAFADGFVQIAARYTPPGGGLSEQFDKKTGLPRSAADLTWSYASVLTANDSHAGIKPASWGAKGLVVPSVCIPNPGPKVNATFNVRAFTTFGGTCMLWRTKLDNDK